MNPLFCCFPIEYQQLITRFCGRLCTNDVAFETVLVFNQAVTMPKSIKSLDSNFFFNIYK